MLGCLEDALAAHAGAARTRAPCWGTVADLAEAESLVRRALLGIGGLTEAQLDRALAAMEAVGEERKVSKGA